MLTMTSESSDKDLSKHRIVEVKNRVGEVINKVHLEQRDPYGHWHVWLDKGQFPQDSPLLGVYTLLDLAHRDIENYIRDRNADVSQIRELTPGPVTEVKAVSKVF